MQIKQLNKSAYAGRKFTARYFTDGYYDIRQTESGFNIAYTPFEKTLEKSLDYEFFEEWLEDPVAFGAFDGENLLGFVEGSSRNGTTASESAVSACSMSCAAERE